MIDVRYTVYDVKTDLPLIVSGTIPQCARAIGLTVNSFQSQPLSSGTDAEKTAANISIASFGMKKRRG